MVSKSGKQATKKTGRSAVTVAKGDFLIANCSRQGMARLFKTKHLEAREAALNDSVASETSDSTMVVRTDLAHCIN